MKLWSRVTGAIKDRLSLITAANDNFTAAIIKSTSHDDLSMDFENVRFIYRHIQSNPSSFKPIIRAISSRVERTRSWTVALKSLMLIHGLFVAGDTAVESIGRLPFDLSGFGKSKSRFSRTGRFSIFVRAYFSFLDERSILFFHDDDVAGDPTIIVEMQRIVDSLMRIKPIGETMKTPLVIETMEYLINEVFEIYDQICRRFAGFLSEFQYDPGNSSELAMKIAAKSLSQGEQLFKYFEICRDLGVTKAREIPDFVRVTESDMIVLDKLLRNSRS